ncbi:tetratricopeptide repeat protein [Actinopolyspora mortivallis]|uniref:tetratricopeptide repeat protein n=1 Tax=Actinopolyspora mortivallis TaxID=33906 RepID=UPI00036D0187|nr:tetratricopeptide repeat protein [Actinopolyspora mortivallis]
MAENGSRPRWFGPRFSALLVAVILLGYLVLMGSRALTMLLSGKPVVMLLGAAVLVLPILGVVLVVDQLRFGMSTQRLAARLAEEGRLPDHSHLPLRPSGRVRRDAADTWFEQKRVELEETPGDWRAWYALAQAYDLAGDRNRGRKAMRKAIDLERCEGTET